MHISMPGRSALLAHNFKCAFLLRCSCLLNGKLKRICGKAIWPMSMYYVVYYTNLLRNICGQIYQDNKSVLRIRTRLHPKCESVALPLGILSQSQVISHELEVKDAMSDQCCLGLQKLILCPVKHCNNVTSCRGIESLPGFTYWGSFLCYYTVFAHIKHTGCFKCNFTALRECTHLLMSGK